MLSPNNIAVPEIPPKGMTRLVEPHPPSLLEVYPTCTTSDSPWSSTIPCSLT